MEAKHCPKCKTEKPVGEFYRSSVRTDGLSAWCVLCQREAGRTSSAKRRAELLALLGGVCVRCGFDDARALQVDHVGGGGHQERIGGVWAANRGFVNRVRANPDRYQLLCANCNQIKKHEAQEFVGVRVYGRDVPTERLEGVGKGNAPAQRAALDYSSERQRARARSYWDNLTPEQREERRRKQSAATTGRKLVDGHWVHPDS